MAGRSVAVVLVPRFSTFVGTSACYSQPIPVSAYASLTFDYWQGAMNGTPAVGVQITAQESNDGDTWESCAGGSPWVTGTASAQIQRSAVLTKAWLRFGITPLGTQPAVTCWVQGFFELRERGPKSGS